MKAKIDGIELEGTPEEILKYQDLYNKKKNEKAEQKINYTIKVEPMDIDVNKVTSKIWETIEKNPYGNIKYPFNTWI